MAKNASLAIGMLASTNLDNCGTFKAHQTHSILFG
jgi:hypothetical protein